MGNDTVIEIEGVSKAYRLGVVNHGLLYRDLQSWWARLRGREDPNAKIVERPLDLESAGRIDGERFFALHELTLQVRRGEILGIIGRNGAGKSTLLKILSRVTAPTSGEVRMRGRIASLLEVGTGFHPELTGRENIFLNGAILGMSKAEIGAKLERIVEFAELGLFLDTPVKRYSSGMYVRLAFAVAAHLDADILVVDEVLAVGDAAFQKKCLGRMEDVAGSGRTVLFVSHNMSAVSSLCTRAVLLKNGRLVADAEPGLVVSTYLADVANLSSIELDTRTDRAGSGTARVVGIDVRSLDADGVVRCNSRLRVTIRYRAEGPIRRPSAAMSINDARQVGIFLLRTDTDPGFPEEIPPQGELVCETGPLNLTPGRCSVNVALFRGGVGGGSDMLDHVEHAGSFDIEPMAFYASGKLPEREWVIGLIEQRWSARTVQ